MYKKLTIFLIVLSLFFITACGKKDDEKEKNNDNKDLNEVNDSVSEATVSGDVLYEDELYKIIFNGFSYDENSFFVRLNIENKTDVEVSVEANDETINSVMMPDVFYKVLAPKTETEFYIYYDSSELTKKSINSLDDVKEVAFELCFWKTGNEDLRREIDLKLYPHEEHEYDYINYVKQEDDVVLLENDDFIIYCTGYSKYRTSAVYMHLYAYNKTNKNINIMFEESRVNGKNKSTTPKQLHILPGRELVDDFSWWVDEETISNFKTLSFKVVIRDADTYIDTYYTSEVINLNPVVK